MKRIIRKCLGISMSVAGGIIGVGFASGREIVSFFARFGLVSLLYCFLSGMAFFVLSYIILLINHENKKRKNMKNIVKNVHIINKNSNKFAFFDIFLFLSQIMICGAMFAGLYVLLNDLYFPHIHLYFLISVF